MTKLHVEQNIPTAAKKIWHIIRVIFFMLRKEISRRKLMSDLNLMLKRGKIAGKAISSLMTFHHHHQSHHPSAAPSEGRAGPSAVAEYEFSCRSSPAGSNYPLKYLNNNNFFSSFHFRKRHNNFHGLFGCAHLPRTSEDDEADVASFCFNAAALEMISEEDQVSEMPSPMLPGFGRTPMARQLRITDSPFPLKDDRNDGQIDKAAEEFIKKFYRALEKQKSG